MLKSTFSSLRKNLLGVVTLIVFALLLVSYFKVYLPARTNSTNSEKFRVLSGIASNLQNKVINLKQQGKLIKSLLDTIKYSKTNDPLEFDTLVKNDWDEYHNPHINKYISESKLHYKIGKVWTTGESVNESIYSKQFVKGIKKDTVLYHYLLISWAWRDFMSNMLRNDFNTYMLVNNKRLLYSSDSSLGLSFDSTLTNTTTSSKSVSAATFDTTYFDSHLHFITPYIQEIYVGGQGYKLFIFPFSFDGDNTMFICGLVPLNTYNAEIKKIPSSTVYLLVLIIVLFVLLFPFLKLVFINESERLGTSDLLMAIGSMMFICVALTTSIIFHIENTKQLGEETEQKRNKLRNDVYSQFTQTLDSCCINLQRCDKIVSADSTKFRLMNLYTTDTTVRAHGKADSVFRGWAYDNIGTKDNPGKNKKNKLRQSGGGIYTDTDHIVKDTTLSKYLYSILNVNTIQYYWLNKAGTQIRDWAKTADDTTGGNYAGREYFQHALNNSGNYTPSIKLLYPATFYISPILSWTSGDFETVISSQSQAKGLKVACVSLKLHHFTPFTPQGYGFNIIDSKGKVQYSSEPMKGQNENMIKECSDSSDFTGAIHSKTIQTFEQNYHSELVDCMISPIGGTPYFLVVYNKKSNESERLWYTIFFTYPCMIALFVFVILLFGMINILKRTSTNHNLKTKNLQFDWIWPRKENKKQYWLICAFNLFILLFTSLYLGFDFIAGSVTVETH